MALPLKLLPGIYAISCLKFWEKKGSKIRCRSHKLPATVWYDDDDFHKSGIMVLVRREKPSTPPLTQKDCCWQLDTAGLRSSSFILLSFPSFFPPRPFFSLSPEEHLRLLNILLWIYPNMFAIYNLFPPSRMAKERYWKYSPAVSVHTCVRWRAVHFTPGPSLTSYLGHPEWIHLILPWIWHHGSWTHTESH